MAYNQAHKTKGFRPAREPGILIPEDRRGLALCTRVFPKLKFDANQDLPENYQWFQRVISLGPMDLPGHPVYEPVLTAPSGEDNLGDRAQKGGLQGGLELGVARGKSAKFPRRCSCFEHERLRGK